MTLESIITIPIRGVRLGQRVVDLAIQVDRLDDDAIVEAKVVAIVEPAPDRAATVIDIAFPDQAGRTRRLRGRLEVDFSGQEPTSADCTWVDGFKGVASPSARNVSIVVAPTSIRRPNGTGDPS